MKIKLNDTFYAEQKEHGFDLIQIKTINKVDKNRKPTGETHKKDCAILFNTSLDRCIKQAVHLTLESNSNKVNLTEFLEAYRTELKRIDRMVRVAN